MTTVHFPIGKILVTRIERDPGKPVFVAESAEYNIASQASSLERLWHAFGHVFFGTVLVSFERNEPVRFGAPFKDVTGTWAKLEEDRIEPDMKVKWYEFCPDWMSDAIGKLGLMFGASSDMDEVEIRFRAGVHSSQDRSKA